MALRTACTLACAAAALAVAPAGAAGARLAVVTNSTGDDLSVFSVASDGSLGTPAAVASQGTDPIDVAISPDARRAFVTNSDSGTVAAFAIDAAGTLAPLGAPVPTGGTLPRTIVTTPDGAFAFAANGGPSNSIAPFSFAANGSLTALGAPVAAGASGPQGMAVSPDSRRLYVAANGGQVASFAISADGALTAAGAPVAAGMFPFAIAVTPDQGPVARIAAPGAVVAGRSTRLDGRGSTGADGTVVRFDWDFGDGTTLSGGGPQPRHTYGRAGVFTARLRVTDDQGCSAPGRAGPPASCSTARRGGCSRAASTSG